MKTNKEIKDYIFIGTAPCPADAIFVVGGSLPEAAELAADLYDKKYADKIIIGGKYSVIVFLFLNMKQNMISIKTFC